jgi:hypothetical protein
MMAFVSRRTPTLSPSPRRHHGSHALPCLPLFAAYALVLSLWTAWRT